MSCLLPHFKCLPDTFRTHPYVLPTHLSKLSSFYFSLQLQLDSGLIFSFLRTVGTSNQFIKYAAKTRENLCFQPHCILSATSPSTSTSTSLSTATATAPVLNLQQLALSTLDAPSDPLSANTPWAYAAALAPPPEVPYTIILYYFQITQIKFHHCCVQIPDVLLLLHLYVGTWEWCRCDLTTVGHTFFLFHGQTSPVIYYACQ